ncbi:Glutamyl-tRNA reductase 1, chloroplastic [Hordeum vulgare]|nr:Glutamyl-tRNA reductase 1, chloroplastic [Hordeum vulgare]
MIKINTDGSFVPGEESSGWGMVLRDSTGSVIAARAGRQPHVQDAFAAELYALAHAISFAAELGVVRVILETDCSLLMEAMDLARVDASAYATVIENLKRFYSNDPPKGGRNKGKPDGYKKEKARAKRSAEASTLTDQISEMAKIKEIMVAMHWDTKVAMAKKKYKHKEEKWEKQCAFEDCKITLEEQNRRFNRTAEEDRFMMMNREGMDAMEVVLGLAWMQ